MTTVWEEFGIALQKARAARGWNQAAVAEVAFGNADRKGYVSQIEKGRTRLQLSTIRKLATALNLPDSVTEPLYRADLPAEDVVAEDDRTAERLMREVAADAAVAPPSEALLIALAYQFAPGSHRDLMTAYNGLKAALEAAADIKARGQLPQNTSDQVQLVLLRMAALNDQGLRDEAASEVDAAIADLDASHAAHKAALTDIALRQDRIRNDPLSAANRVLAQLRSVAHPGGLFNAIRDTGTEWHDRGYDKGVGFDLHVALHLARANLDRAKGGQRGMALSDLGNVQLHLGERAGKGTWLTDALRTFGAMLAEFPRHRDPHNWALANSNLGSVLQELGTREVGTERLEQSLTANLEALKVQSQVGTPLEWAKTQNNLGNTLGTLGEREVGTARLEEALTAYGEALREWTRDNVPLDWAGAKHNFARPLVTLGEREAGTDRFESAVGALNEALEEWTRDRVPMDWAMSQNNLGRALCRWGERANDVAKLERSIAAFDEALLERTRDRVPLDWATTRGNRAEAMALLAEHRGDLAFARLALDQLQEAEVILRDGGHEDFARYSATLIPKAEAVIIRRS